MVTALIQVQPPMSAAAGPADPTQSGSESAGVEAGESARSGPPGRAAAGPGPPGRNDGDQPCPRGPAVSPRPAVSPGQRPFCEADLDHDVMRQARMSRY